MKLKSTIEFVMQQLPWVYGGFTLMLLLGVITLTVASIRAHRRFDKPRHHKQNRWP